MMDSMIENDPTLPIDFDQSSINFLNLQAKRLNDFSMLDSPHQKETESRKVKDGDVERTRNGRYSNDQSPERPLSRGVTTMRDEENLIGELKKECFGLKLRIYYMEEQLRENFDVNIEDMLKENVELKVAVGELKNDIAYKTELLTKASQAMQLMSEESSNRHDKVDGDDENNYKHQLGERDERIKSLEDEIYQLNEKLAEYDNNKEDKEKKLQRLLNEKDEKYKLLVVKKQQDEESLKSMIFELEQTLVTKESNIETLRNDLRRLASNNNADRGSQHYKALYERTGKILSEKENDMVQLKCDIANKSKLIDSLNEHIAKFDQGLKDTRNDSDEKELELNNTIYTLQKQIKKLQDTVQEKVSELQEKDKTLTAAKEENLLVHQQKVQYELDNMKTKDSHIIELEIKVKQQSIDLERTVDEHNRTLREKDDDVLRLQGLYLAAQQEIKRMKAEEKEYRSLNNDLKNSLEKGMEKERSMYLHLENLLSRPNEHKELEKVTSEFIKNLQSQLAEKDIYISELKGAKDDVITSASHKYQKLFSQVKDQEVMIMDLNKALSMKNKEIDDMAQKSSAVAATNVSEHNNLLSALLREKNEKDDTILSLTKSLQDKDEKIAKLVVDNDSLLEKDDIIESLRKQVEELKTSLAQVKSEKLNLDTEYRSLQLQKESLQKQLGNLKSLVSEKEAEPNVKEVTSMSNLEELEKVFESVIETYKSLVEKLNNNQHPDSQQYILNQEMKEVENTRKSFHHLLVTILNKTSVTGENELYDIVKKDKTLKFQLEESRKRTSSLEEQLFGISKYQRENESLRKDIKKYEGNDRKLKELTEQMEKMKLEYERLVSEREEEISVLMKNMHQEKQVTELLTQQKEMLSQQLEEKQKKISQEITSLEDTKVKLTEKSIEFVKLEGLVEDKDTCILDLRKEISLLQTKNADLNHKLALLQLELNTSHDNLSKLTSDLKNAELNITSLETQLNTSIENGTCEKRTLKKDVKELFEMNVRLRKKVKAYELVIAKKDNENGKLVEKLEKADDTTKKLEVLLSNSNDKAALEGELEYLRTKIEELESLNETFASLKMENVTLKEKLEELNRLNELNEETTIQELGKMKELVDVFTEENVSLKSDIHKMKQDKEKIIGKHRKELEEKNVEISKLQNSLDGQTRINNEKTNENNMLEYALNKKTKENEDQSIEINSLQNALEKQSETVAEKLCENAKIQDELARKTKEIDEKVSDITSLRTCFENQSLEIKGMENECKKLQIICEKQSKELEARISENKNLQLELGQVKETLADNKLTDKLTAELIESKSMINVLQSKIASFSGNQVDVVRLKEEIKCLEEAKVQLKEENRKLKQSAGEINQKLSITLDNNNMKIEEIKVLKSQMLHLEEKIESFSPLYTSSAHNIALSSDAFTQTNDDICPSGNKDDSLIMQHIKEMQQLRKQLEETISNNDSLRMQLEERLNEVEQDASLMQDPHLRITLIRDNDSMRMKLNEADGNQKKLRQQIDKLKEEKESDAETINTLNSQIHELNVISTNLKMEMEVYDRLIQQLGINKNRQFTNEDFNSDLNPGNDLDKNLLLALLEEIRDLRDQLQLTIDVNNQLREKLEKELGHPVPEEVFKTPRREELYNTPGMSFFTPRSLFSGAVLHSVDTIASQDTSIAQNTQSLADYPSLDETPTKDIGIEATPVESVKSDKQATGSLKNGECCVISGKVKDFKTLKRISCKIYEKLSACLKKLKSQKEKSIVYNDMCEILKLSKELSKLLSSFNVLGNKDVHLKATKCDDSSEFEIATKLLKACDTLKVTKGNLQLKHSRPPSRNNSPNN